MYIILFYTDGGAEYPQDIIEKYKKCGINYYFYSFCDGPSTNELTKITSELKGKLNSQVDPSGVA